MSEAELAGWRVIAATLGVTEKTARRYAKPNARLKRAPLPVTYNFQGRVVIKAQELEDWKLIHARAYETAS